MRVRLDKMIFIAEKRNTTHNAKYRYIYLIFNATYKGLITDVLPRQYLKPKIYYFSTPTFDQKANTRLIVATEDRYFAYLLPHVHVQRKEGMLRMRRLFFSYSYVILISN